MFSIRLMKEEDWPAVAELIHLSTNTWYEVNQRRRAFTGPPSTCELFCKVYEDLDPQCCLVAIDNKTNRPIGSCFMHPRETHISLGIMTVHPSYFSAGVASGLLQRIIAYADDRGLPLRLVSSAMNLDSYSLYNRYGFVPFAIFQDMTINVPKAGLKIDEEEFDLSKIREADLEDVSSMGALEFEVSGISRERDYCYFIENDRDIWHTTVIDSADGEGIDGFLTSIIDPGSNMLGPGIARTPEIAANLIAHHLDTFHRGKSPVFLVPANQSDLCGKMYSLGAKNCELHFAQVRGQAQPIQGVVMPTFMPETG